MASITVVVGPPCAGKSTYIAEQKHAGDVVIDFDRIAQALGSDTPHAAPEPIRAAAFAARKSAIRTVLGGVDADAWIIHTNPFPGQLASYERAGADVVLLDPGVDECLARAAADGRPDGTEDAIRGWYDAPPLLDTDPIKRRRGVPRTKECPARIKAAGPADSLAEGQFVAIVSVFGNEDSVGDVVVPGAFTDTLADWSAKGDPIPVLWSHDWSDPFSHIGVVTDAKETDQGLEVTGQIEDLDTNPTAQQVYRLLKGRRVTQFSFAYDVQEGAWVDTEDDASNPYGYYELRKLKLYEVGPTLVGANQETELLAAKAHSLVRGVKEGRVLAQSHVDRLKDAHQALGDVIDAAEKATEPKGSNPTAQETGQPPAAEPAATEQAPAKAPGLSPAQVLAAALIRKHTTTGGRHADAA